jgi:diguanylate cyclase (GGDEF)-like protein
VLTPQELQQLVVDSYPVNVFDPLSMRMLYQNVASIELFGVMDDFGAFESLRDNERESCRAALNNLYRLNTSQGPRSYHLDIHVKEGAVVHLLKDVSELDAELGELLRGVSTDAMGQCLNRRAFMYALAQEMARAERHELDIQLLFPDIDHLIGINALHGRDGGDYVLDKVSSLIRSTIRQTDVLGRLESDGFGLVLCETPFVGGVSVAKRICQLIESADFRFDGQPIAVTVSVGVSGFRKGDTPQSILQRCEAALEKAARRGMGQVESI